MRRVTIPTLDGDMPLDFDPGTQPGELRVLRGRGMPVLQGFGRGDHRVLVNVLVPRQLTDEQRRLLAEFDSHVGRADVQARRGLLREAQERLPLRRVVVAGGEPELAQLLDLFPQGVEELDDGFAVYVDDAGARTLRERFDVLADDDVAEGWEDNWRGFHHGVVVGRFWIGPPWEEPPAGAEAVVIDPGRAFGTGAHPTTRLTLELLQELEPGEPARRRLRLRRALDRRREARLRAAARRRRRPRRGRGHASRTPRANGVEIDARVCDALTDELPDTGARGRERRARRRRGAARRAPAAGASRPATSSGTSRASQAGGRSTGARTTAGPLISSSAPEPFIVSPWRRSRSASSAARSRTSTRTRCASGCSPTGTSSATAPPTSRSSTRAASRTRRVSKSRKEAARAARTHRRVYVTGCGANLAADAFAGLPENVVVVARRSEETPAFVAGDVGAIGCVQADARFDRVRAFVKVQDGCSFSCNFCVIPLVRGASRSRSRRRRAPRDRAPRRAGPSRGRAHRHQPRLLPRPRPPATTCRASCARRARRPGSSGCGSRRSRSTTSTTR